MAFAAVQWGPYWGSSLAEMQAEKARVKAAVLSATHGPKNIVGASVNGKSFSYGPSGVWSLTQWQAEVQDAMSQVDDSVAALPSETVAIFTGA